MTPHRVVYLVGVGLLDDGDEPALARDIQRIEPKYFARGADGVAHRHRRFVDYYFDVRDFANSLITVATPPRVASRMHRMAPPQASMSETSP